MYNLSSLQSTKIRKADIKVPQLVRPSKHYKNKIFVNLKLQFIRVVMPPLPVSTLSMWIF